MCVEIKFKKTTKLHNFNINLLYVYVNKPSKCIFSLYFYVNSAVKLYIESHTDRSISKKLKERSKTILYFKKESRNNINFKIV